MDLKVLKNKNLVLVILGQFVSGFGTFMQNFALSIYVLKKTGSATLFASVLVVSIIPRILLMPFAGVLADRFSRKKMIVLMDLASSLTVVIMIIVFLITGELSIVTVYILVIMLSLISVFFMPSMSAIIPDIVKKDKLVDANSAMELFSSIIGLTSPLVAGLLFGLFGLLPIMIINAISFFASAISEMFIRIKHESIQKKENRESFFASFKQGIIFIKSLPEFIFMAGIAVVANFAIAPIFSVSLPIVFLQDFGLSEQIYGVLSSLMTIGMFMAPIFAAKIIRKYHYSKLVSFILTIDAFLCIGIAILSIVGIFPSIIMNIVLMMIIINILIVTVVWVNLSIATARQLLVPGEMMGRVTSVIGTFAMMATPLGQALMGSLLDVSESYIIIGIYAVILLIVGLISKVGFNALATRGKMDLTVGVTVKKELGTDNG
ncbi:MAG: MFS transporter [Clostridiales bacterium]|nr:MFS transporter [Clostridiales bacterium]